mmetsp:Transcript_14270/g.33346  ORF Transcript_14270/g.33346 Transcript_14270/m.33346 type:complete len:323 (-) Transcript_14270:75-1043(-)
MSEPLTPHQPPTYKAIPILCGHPCAVTVDADGIAVFSDWCNYILVRQPHEGRSSVVSAKMKQPSGLALDHNTIVACDGETIVRVDEEGVVSLVAGADGSPGFVDGENALFNGPKDVAVGHDGSIFVADSRNHAIRVICEGEVTTLAGNGRPGFEDGSSGCFNEPIGIVVHPDGSLVVADRGNHALRRVALDGTISTLALRTPSGDPMTIRQLGAICVDAHGTIYFSDTLDEEFACACVVHRVCVGDGTVTALLRATDTGSMEEYRGDNAELWLGQNGCTCLAWANDGSLVLGGDGHGICYVLGVSPPSHEPESMTKPARGGT